MARRSQRRRDGAKRRRPSLPHGPPWNGSQPEPWRRRNADGGRETEEQRGRKRDGGTETEGRRRRNRDGGAESSELTGQPFNTEARRYGGGLTGPPGPACGRPPMGTRERGDEPPTIQRSSSPRSRVPVSRAKRGWADPAQRYGLLGSSTANRAALPAP